MSKHPIHFDVNAYPVPGDGEFAFLSPQRNRTRHGSGFPHQHVARGILVREDPGLAAAQAQREEIGFFAQAHGHFNVGGQHRGMVLADEKAEEASPSLVFLLVLKTVAHEPR